jgi:type IV pilus assembly protein PilO
MDQLVERIARASLGLKVGVVAAILVVLTAVNYFVASIPWGPSISEVERKIAAAEVQQRKLDAEYIEKTAIANDLNRFRRERELLEQKLAEALAELPQEKNIDELLQQFQDRAQKAGLQIESIEPKGEVAAGFYARLPIAMKVNGNFHEVATFFDSVGRLRRIVNVSEIVLDQPKDVSGKVLVNASFTATAFMFVQAKPPAGGKGAQP